MPERYSLLKAHLDALAKKAGAPPPNRYSPSAQATPITRRNNSREPRCGPWEKREDGSFVCLKCGDVDAPGSGPFGF